MKRVTGSRIRYAKAFATGTLLIGCFAACGDDANSALPAAGATAYQPYIFDQGVEFEQTLTSDQLGTEPTVVGWSIPRTELLSEPSGVADHRTPASKIGDDVDLSGPWVDVVIAFASPSRLPVLPRLLRHSPRDSAANRDIQQRRQQTVEQAAKQRRAHVADLLAQISRAGGTVLEHYLVGNAVWARLPSQSVLALVNDSRVISVNAATAPDSFGSLADARSVAGTDRYWDYAITGSGAGHYVGLLDTGVRLTHRLLAGRIYWYRDCVNGGNTCENTGSPLYDPSDDPTWSHGTMSASTIAATTALGNATRGVTDVSIDSFKVGSKRTGLNVPAMLKAFDAALAGGDDIIGTTVTYDASEVSPISLAADDAFDSGMAVIASAGNGFGSIVGAPANAHKVLAAGGFYTGSGLTIDEQSFGPSADGRTKPDLQFPSYYDAGSAAGDSALENYGGTSAAGSFGAGAAMLVFDWLATSGLATNPGIIYAAMLAFGNDPVYPYDNIVGAGHLVLDDLACRMTTVGARVVAPGQYVDISIPTSANGNADRDLRAAIWWPDLTVGHADIDLRVLRADGVVAAASTGGNGVWEKVMVPGNLSPYGSWKVRITGYSNTTGLPQLVYYFIQHKTWCAL